MDSEEWEFLSNEEFFDYPMLRESEESIPEVKNSEEEFVGDNGRIEFELPAEAAAGQEAPPNQAFFGGPRTDELADMTMEDGEGAGKCEGAPDREQEVGISSPEIVQKGIPEGFGLRVWRWRMTAVGALSSVGFAAATVGVFLLSGHHRIKHRQRNPGIQIQIRHDDKSPSVIRRPL
ncbi:unnamed protein product [Spirodela intermedia]|uniref:DUF6821 domain-containing protein n=1 Tax=Spirodela intermedia TaxID=51605 RepID=A0A7I8JCR7_SPIIN|nr:unnamed protein product [Spirodela intermedia]CAA6667303.1 unnamed protein product [Spirodela intermedia]